MMLLLISLLVSSTVIFISLRLLNLGMKSRNWMAVDGKILDQFEVKELGDASRTQKMNQLLIRYEYSVDGVKYVNDRVRYKWNNHNLDSERKRYPAGLDVTVLVNPENLSQSVLEPGINATNVFSFLAGLFILVSGVLTHFID